MAEKAPSPAASTSALSLQRGVNLMGSAAATPTSHPPLLGIGGGVTAGTPSASNNQGLSERGGFGSMATMGGGGGGDNIRVCARFRPLNRVEESLNAHLLASGMREAAFNCIRFADGGEGVGDRVEIRVPDALLSAVERHESSGKADDVSDLAATLGSVVGGGPSSGPTLGNPLALGGGALTSRSESFVARSPSTSSLSTAFNGRDGGAGGPFGTSPSAHNMSTVSASNLSSMVGSASATTAHAFTFDTVFDPTVSQDGVYAEVGAPIVSDVMEGYNGTIFVYGQTGSGKTFSMMGAPLPNAPVLGRQGSAASSAANTPRRGVGGPFSPGGYQNPRMQGYSSSQALQVPPAFDLLSPDGSGIIPRAVNHLFDAMYDSPETVSFTVSLFFVEIYMERVRDLLVPDPSQSNLTIREDPKSSSFYIEGCVMADVTSPEEIFDLLNYGIQNRATASTRMNVMSSRSHCLLCIAVHAFDSVANEQRIGKLFLVDLAGSEKVAKTRAEGQQLEEAKVINKSLTALGHVINQLSTRAPHIPYRDSKLTKILQDALGGNSKTALIVCCSPSVRNIHETLSTLRFGQRAKAVKNKAVINKQHTIEELKVLLEAAKMEIDTLRRGSGAGLGGPQPGLGAGGDGGAAAIISNKAVLEARFAEEKRALIATIHSLEDGLREANEAADEEAIARREVDRSVSLLKEEIRAWEAEYNTLYLEREGLRGGDDLAAQLSAERRTLAELLEVMAQRRADVAKLRESAQKAVLLLQEELQQAASATNVLRQEAAELRREKQRLSDRNDALTIAVDRERARAVAAEEALLAAEAKWAAAEKERGAAESSRARALEVERAAELRAAREESAAAAVAQAQLQQQRLQQDTASSPLFAAPMRRDASSNTNAAPAAPLTAIASTNTSESITGVPLLFSAGGGSGSAAAAGSGADLRNGRSESARYASPHNNASPNGINGYAHNGDGASNAEPSLSRHASEYDRLRLRFGAEAVEASAAAAEAAEADAAAAQQQLSSLRSDVIGLEAEKARLSVEVRALTARLEVRTAQCDNYMGGLEIEKGALAALEARRRAAEGDLKVKVLAARSDAALWRERYTALLESTGGKPLSPFPSTILRGADVAVAASPKKKGTVTPTSTAAVAPAATDSAKGPRRPSFQLNLSPRQLLQEGSLDRPSDDGSAANSAFGGTAHGITNGHIKSSSMSGSKSPSPAADATPFPVIRESLKKGHASPHSLIDFADATEYDGHGGGGHRVSNSTNVKAIGGGGVRHASDHEGAPLAHVTSDAELMAMAHAATHSGDDPTRLSASRIVSAAGGKGGSAVIVGGGRGASAGRHHPQHALYHDAGAHSHTLPPGAVAQSVAKFMQQRTGSGAATSEEGPTPTGAGPATAAAYDAAVAEEATARLLRMLQGGGAGSTSPQEQQQRGGGGMGAAAPVSLFDLASPNSDLSVNQSDERPLSFGHYASPNGGPNEADADTATTHRPSGRVNVNLGRYLNDGSPSPDSGSRHRRSPNSPFGSGGGGDIGGPAGNHHYSGDGGLVFSSPLGSSTVMRVGAGGFGASAFDAVAVGSVNGRGAIKGRQLSASSTNVHSTAASAHHSNLNHNPSSHYSGGVGGGGGTAPQSAYTATHLGRTASDSPPSNIRGETAAGSRRASNAVNTAFGGAPLSFQTQEVAISGGDSDHADTVGGDDGAPPIAHAWSESRYTSASPSREEESATPVVDPDAL